MSAGNKIHQYFLRNISGILKIGCLLFSLTGILCIIGSTLAGVPLNNFRSCFYLIIMSTGIICTTCIISAETFQLWKYRHYRFDMQKYEIYLHTGLACAYFIACAMAISLDVATYSAAAFFGYLAMCFYCYDAYLAYRACCKRDAMTQTDLSL